MSRKKPNPFADMPGDLLRAVAADPVPAIVLSHAFEGTPGTPCRVCTLTLSHPVHAHGEPGNEVAVRVDAPLARSPALPRLDELRDVLGMLDGAQQRFEREEINGRELARLVREAVSLLRSELGSNAQQRYAERVAAQTARIDAHLNEEGRKQRKRKR